MDEQPFQRLTSQISQGRAILFTGAGFSIGAPTRAGGTVPSVRTLTEELSAIAFPGEDFDGSSLQDTFDAAVMQARTATIELLRSRLSVDPQALPDHYRRWFALPWYRIYTLNIDDLADAANLAFDLPRMLIPISAQREGFVAGEGELQVVHLNGRLADVPDHVTFTGRQYAERLATPDPWYASLARELTSHPVVYVGTTLDEPPLWQYVEARGTRPSRGRELRPGSYLVSPDIRRARAVALRQYNVDWVRATAQEFSDEVLVRLDAAAEEGLRTLRAATGNDIALLDVSELRSDSVGDEREYLLGREPRFSDLTDGFAIERNFDADLADVVTTNVRLIVITGTAGSGKSTSAMRLALALSAEGNKVVKLNHDALLRANRIRRAVQADQPDVLLIDDLERLGGSAAGVLRDVREAVPDVLVIAALRSARYDSLGVNDVVAQDDAAYEAAAPPLADEDIDALLDALDRANRLGHLRGMPRLEQRNVFASKAGRQLLVALIEATSGLRFDEKIESECRELEGDAALLYAVVALATSFRVPLQDAELLTAAGGEPTVAVRALDGLLRTHLLVRDQRGRLALRHRLVADKAVEYYRSHRLVEPALRGLVFALAAAARPGKLRDSSQGRALIRLINHKLLIDFLRRPLDPVGTEPDVVAIRGVYEEIEGLLTHDYHYWLQRSSFETEEGSLELAKNFIEQARALAPDDPYVRTQWAYATLKRASRQPDAPGSPEQVELAFGELDEAIEQRGRIDAYAFHVYGSQGLAWSNRAHLTVDERTTLLQTLRRVVDEGLELHPQRRDLRQLARDLEAAYLRLATTESPAGSSAQPAG